MQFANAVKQRLWYASSGFDHAFLLDFRLCTTWSERSVTRRTHVYAIRSDRHALPTDTRAWGWSRYGPILRILRYKRVHVAPTRRANRWTTVSCQIEPAVGTGNKSGKRQRMSIPLFLAIVSIPNDTHSELTKCNVKNSRTIRTFTRYERMPNSKTLSSTHKESVSLYMCVKRTYVQLCAPRACACMYIYRPQARSKWKGERERERKTGVYPYRVQTPRLQKSTAVFDKNWSSEPTSRNGTDWCCRNWYHRLPCRSGHRLSRSNSVCHAVKERMCGTEPAILGLM